MLSAETAVGQYPVEVVQVMDRIVRAAEVETGPGFVRRVQADTARMSFVEAICLSASSAAAATGAGAIVAFSERGMTARLVSKQRPVAPIIAFTPFETIRRQMALYWGVLPHTMAQISTTDERVREAERRLKAEASGEDRGTYRHSVRDQSRSTRRDESHEIARGGVSL